MKSKRAEISLHLLLSVAATTVVSVQCLKGFHIFFYNWDKGESFSKRIFKVINISKSVYVVHAS